MTGLASDFQEDVCDVRTLQRISALLDRPDKWENGDVLPRGWHFAFFIPAEPQSRLPPDGFALPTEEGVEVPHNARVMLGGRTASFNGDIRVGQSLRRKRTVASVEQKTGRAGLLTIVNRRHEIFAGDSAEPSIEETEAMVYRAPVAAPSLTPSPSHGSEPVRGDGFRADYHPTPVELFRYSALTFNGHRIHYDAPYAINAEGYPNLVVNGGLTALKLVELFRSAVGREPVHTATRNRGALYCGVPATLNLETIENGYRLWAADPEGHASIEMVVR